MPPKPMRDTRRPVLPNVVYSICTLSLSFCLTLAKRLKPVDPRSIIAFFAFLGKAGMRESRPNRFAAADKRFPRILRRFSAILSRERLAHKPTWRDCIMENQTINCSVSSCRHHNAQNRCELRSINVCANCNCHSGKERREHVRLLRVRLQVTKGTSGRCPEPLAGA